MRATSQSLFEALSDGIGIRSDDPVKCIPDISDAGSASVEREGIDSIGIEIEELHLPQRMDGFI